MIYSSMRTATFCLFSVITALFVTGCTMTGKKPGTRRETEALPGSISIDPPALKQQAGVKTVAEDPIPVYKPTKLVKVRVGAYIDKNGQAWPETYKYVVAEKGGWNIAALENPDRAYIPAENTVNIPGAPGVLPGTISPGSIPQSQPAASSARVLYDMSQVRLTGYFEDGDEGKARAIAENLKAKGELGEYAVGKDPDLGWIIMPATAILQNPGAIPVQDSRAIPQKSTHAPAGDQDVR